MTKMTIKDWGQSTDFKHVFVLEKHHTARLKKVLASIFPKKEGWKFSVSKNNPVSLSVTILEIPIDIKECISLEALRKKLYYRNLLDECNGTYEEQLAHIKNKYLDTIISGGYAANKSDYIGIMYDVLKIIEDIIDFSIAPQENISEDSDYGRIPNYYSDVVFGKLSPLNIVKGIILNKKEYEDKLNKIKEEVKNLRAFENVMENF